MEMQCVLMSAAVYDTNVLSKDWLRITESRMLFIAFYFCLLANIHNYYKV
jgi:hypothetical protein